jgi:hypothetical protein
MESTASPRSGAVSFAMAILDGSPFSALREANSVLVTGAGGGFDIYAGIPLALALWREGKSVTLANLSFTYLGGTDARRLDLVTAVVEPDTRGERKYFPERVLAEWLYRQRLPPTVYAFEKVGARPLRDAYQAIVNRHDIDAVVLVDGGTDIVMRGDEVGLGTPQEDMASLAAVHGLQVPVKMVACLGFGIDTFHGVCHAHFLENVSSLMQSGGFLGSMSLLPAMPEVVSYLDLVEFSNEITPLRPSIVNTSIASSLQGFFGDYQRTHRTSSSELFINPLMGMYWGFDLDILAKANLYLPDLFHTETMADVARVIENFRAQTQSRPWRGLPM